MGLPFIFFEKLGCISVDTLECAPLYFGMQGVPLFIGNYIFFAKKKKKNRTMTPQARKIERSIVGAARY